METTVLGFGQCQRLKVSTGMIGGLLGLSVWDFGSRVQRLRFEV